MKLMIRLLVLMLCLCFLMLFPAVYAHNGGEEDVYLGDVNQDGKIDVGDAILVLRSIVGLTNLVGETAQVADVNLDGNVDVGDAIQILRRIAGLIQVFPVSDPAVVSTERALLYLQEKTDAGGACLAADILLTEPLLLGRRITIDGAASPKNHIINGDVDITASGVIFNNLSVAGIVTVASAVTDFKANSAELDVLVLNGGGSDSIHLNGVNIGELHLNADDITVNIDGESTIEIAYINASPTINGSSSIKNAYLISGAAPEYPDGQEPVASSCPAILSKPGHVLLPYFLGDNLNVEWTFELRLGYEQFAAGLDTDDIELGGVFSGEGVTFADLNVTGVSRHVHYEHHAFVTLGGVLNISKADWDAVHGQPMDGNITVKASGHTGDVDLIVNIRVNPLLGSGAFFDEVIFTVAMSDGVAVQQLKAGEIDIYAFSITDPALFGEIAAEPDLNYDYNYRSYRDFRFNTWGPEFDTGDLNPFSVPAIREAFNSLIDRQHIIDEYLGGLGNPKWTALGSSFPDHQERYPHIVGAIEAYYTHNPGLAESIITSEMNNLGAELIGEKWHYEGQEVEIKFLIRTDLPPFPAAGDYGADLVENLGFTVERMYKTGAEASSIWIGSHPREGLFHIYTGGWLSPTIQRDSGGIFDQMYTHRVMPFPLWAVLEEQLEDWPELDEASRKLRLKEFTTMVEREELFETVLWEAMKFSNQVWLLDVAGVSPYRSDVAVAVDTAGGITDSSWVYTAHRHLDGVLQPGGNLRIGLRDLFMDPWNPVGGSAWSYDMFATRSALGDTGTLQDPHDGLHWPQRIERADVYIREGLPVEATHDWVTLEVVPVIEVPPDAWADWDAAGQQFITVGERFGSGGTTALVKSVVHYPDDLFDRTLHDGSKLSIGDFVMAMIVGFDRAKEESPIFDESVVGDFNNWLNTFKGVKIVSEDPLVIEIYSDVWYLDAEEIASISTWWPAYGTYDWPGFWHMITVGKLAEADGALAFSRDKADSLEVGWMDYTRGPSLPILESYMNGAAGENYIPYAPTLESYISTTEAEERWNNLQAFNGERGHFWVGAGPYILKSVDPDQKTVALERFEDYPDSTDKWFFLSNAP